VTEGFLASLRRAIPIYFFVRYLFGLFPFASTSGKCCVAVLFGSFDFYCPAPFLNRHRFSYTNSRFYGSRENGTRVCKKGFALLAAFQTEHLPVL